MLSYIRAQDKNYCTQYKRLDRKSSRKFSSFLLMSDKGYCFNYSLPTFLFYHYAFVRISILYVMHTKQFKTPRTDKTANEL